MQNWLVKSISVVLKLNYWLLVIVIFGNIYLIFVDTNLKFYFFENSIIDSIVRNSLFPLQADNAIQFTSFISFIILPFNILVNIILLIYFFQKIDADFFNNLKNKNKILFVSGFYILDPYKTESNLSKFNFVKKIIAVLFYLWIIFLTFHQVLDLNYIDFPRVKYLFYLICNFKFFLFILNVGLFFIINSIWLGFLGAIAIAIKLIFISIFHEFYDIPHS